MQKTQISTEKKLLECLNPFQTVLAQYHQNSLSLHFVELNSLCELKSQKVLKPSGNIFSIFVDASSISVIYVVFFFNWRFQHIIRINDEEKSNESNNAFSNFLFPLEMEYFFQLLLSKVGCTRRFDS